MDWTYSVSDAVAMPQNTNQVHVVIDETMSFKATAAKFKPKQSLAQAQTNVRYYR